jgi:uncharacterized protein YndB with AHSA1/START domain
MSSNTVNLHRVIKAPVEKVYKAFTDPIAMAAWLPPYGFLCTVQHMDVKVGGSYRMTFHNFTTGGSHSFGGDYIEVVPNEKLLYTDAFEDPNLPGQMLTTIQLKAVIGGTELYASQSGIPELIPVEMCYLGWQESLEKLTKLVEPNIPEG